MAVRGQPDRDSRAPGLMDPSRLPCWSSPRSGSAWPRPRASRPAGAWPRRSSRLRTGPRRARPRRDRSRRARSSPNARAWGSAAPTTSARRWIARRAAAGWSRTSSGHRRDAGGGVAAGDRPRGRAAPAPPRARPDLHALPGSVRPSSAASIPSGSCWTPRHPAWAACGGRRVAYDRLRPRLEQLVHSSDVGGALQEPIVTLRNGRYVIPVKAEARTRVKGIVHDASGSGQTLFVEPLVAVELGNAWREAQLAEAVEVERILDELSAVVAARPADRETLDALAPFDFWCARRAWRRDGRGPGRAGGPRRDRPPRRPPPRARPGASSRSTSGWATATRRSS